MDSLNIIPPSADRWGAAAPQLPGHGCMFSPTHDTFQLLTPMFLYIAALKHRCLQKGASPPMVMTSLRLVEGLTRIEHSAPFLVPVCRVICVCLCVCACVLLYVGCVGVCSWPRKAFKVSLPGEAKP